MLENKENTPLAELGEFGVIQHLTSAFEIKNSDTIKAVGDDAAVINFDSKKAIITTDMLVEGVHFDLSYVPLKHLGYKAIVCNLSDIYAMNGEAKQVTVSIAVSSRFTVEALEELYTGIYLACEKYNIDLIGGDTTSSNLGLVISVTAIGEAPLEKIVYRNGAKEGDLLVVSGDLGAAYIGLQILEREKKIFLESPDVQPDLEGNDYMIERQLKPEARKDIVSLLNKLEVQPTAMIDISDGLASEILHICSQSKVGVKLYEEKIPIDPQTFNRAVELSIDPSVCALSGGEDYELLFTINQSDFEKIKGNPNLTIIGHIVNSSEGCALVSKTNTLVPITAQGWNAFRERTSS